MNPADAIPEGLIEELEQLRPRLHAAGLRVEIVPKRHRHGFLLFLVHVNEGVREVSGAAEAIEYLHGLCDGAEQAGGDALSQLSRAVLAARKEKP